VVSSDIKGFPLRFPNFVAMAFHGCVYKREPTMIHKPNIERCTAWVTPVGCAVVDGHRCKLAASTERDGHRVCSCHAVTRQVRYVPEPAATGRRTLERT
jgi:hypothetical protein